MQQIPETGAVNRRQYLKQTYRLFGLTSYRQVIFHAIAKFKARDRQRTLKELEHQAYETVVKDLASMKYALVYATKAFLNFETAARQNYRKLTGDAFDKTSPVHDLSNRLRTKLQSCCENFDKALIRAGGPQAVWDWLQKTKPEAPYGSPMYYLETRCRDLVQDRLREKQLSPAEARLINAKKELTALLKEFEAAFQHYHEVHKGKIGPMSLVSPEQTRLAAEKAFTNKQLAEKAKIAMRIVDGLK